MKMSDTNSVLTTKEQPFSEYSNHSNLQLKLNKSCYEDSGTCQHRNILVKDEAVNQSIPLTGDPVVDADILTFIRAREKIRSRRLFVEQQKKANVQNNLYKKLHFFSLLFLTN
ncbi:unnamed protein product [Heterobilharzia americana]|nr:unnamed protein product [Heterobilharzia americana]